MEAAELNIVTGAFGYIGKDITRRLLSLGKGVKTLTRHPHRPNPFGEQVMAFPFNFDNPAQLTESLRGATTLYNTYWVRFPYQQVTFERAVENTRRLIAAAEEAGLRRIIHISITNASPGSPLPYFRGKGLAEEAIIHSRLSYAIIRPTVIFGADDILINNIAWLLRRLPIFVIFGSGDYRVQPVFVEDVAGIAVRAGQEQGNLVIDAVGPETYTFDQLVRLIAQEIGSRARLVHFQPALALMFARLIGYVLRDVVITRDEILGLMSGLLVSQQSPKGQMRFSAWVERNANRVGIRYASELARHYRSP